WRNPPRRGIEQRQGDAIALLDTSSLVDEPSTPRSAFAQARMPGRTGPPVWGILVSLPASSLSAGRANKGKGNENSAVGRHSGESGCRVEFLVLREPPGGGTTAHRPIYPAILKQDNEKVPIFSDTSR